MFKDSYLFDFLNLAPTYSERDLQRGLVNNLKSFLLELGGDFCFISEEYRLSVGAKDFYADRLFAIKFQGAVASLVALP